MSESLEASQIVVDGLWPYQAFEQEMIQAESDVESRIAEPGGLGIDENRPLWAHQYIFGTDVAMHQRNTPTQRSIHEVAQRSGKIRVAAPRFEQIGIHAQSIENIRRIECGGQGGIESAGGMQPPKQPADSGGRVRACIGLHQLAFPDWIFGRIQKFHGKQAGLLIMRQGSRHGDGLALAGKTQPGPLVSVAGHWSLPVGGNFQVGERPLDA